MPLRAAEVSGVSPRAVRWLWPATVLAVLPKCLVCVFAYAGVGAALGLGGPELCGGSNASPLGWATALAWLGAVSGLGVCGIVANRRRERAASANKNSRGTAPGAP